MHCEPVRERTELLLQHGASLAETMQELHNIYIDFDRWQATKVGAHDCGGGCAACCYHWVDDVYSFEGALIAAYLKKAHPTLVAQFKEFAKDDVEAMKDLAETLSSDLEDPETELLLQFMELKRPCPLLSAEGMCLAYDVRPLTCRSFFSGNKGLCQPESCRSDDKGGPFLITPGEEAEELLDELHFVFDEGKGSSLRGLLAELL